MQLPKVAGIMHLRDLRVKAARVVFASAEACLPQRLNWPVILAFTGLQDCLLSKTRFALPAERSILPGAATWTLALTPIVSLM